MASATEILKQYWGYAAFRPLQEEIIQSVLADRDTLALMPTGAGKSLCYQVPAVMQDGFCLVISPLIALMQDQVKRLKEQHIPAAFLHAGMHRNEVRQTLENMIHGPYKLLYVSPERLQTDLFREYLPSFNISLLAVDEAHCISQWGYDFRPDYMEIGKLREEFPEVPMLALTASATREVQEDIISKLGMKQAAIHSRSFKRENIFYEVRYSENKVSDSLQALPDTGAAIIYCRSRRQTEVIAQRLSSEGFAAGYYHAGMDKKQREEAQESWMTDEKNIIAATTAFGMGIDKPDVRLVLHYDAPEHCEAYYQEAGRAGRDGRSSRALLLYNSPDINRLRESTGIQYPGEAYLRQVYQAVNEYLQIPIGVQPDRYFPFELQDFCSKFKLEASRAGYALRLLAQEGLWTITEAAFRPASVYFTSERQELDRLAERYPKLGLLITTLLRMYSTVFHFPTTVSVIALAQRLRMDKAEVEQGLKQLHAMEVLEYSVPVQGPQLWFHHLRVDSRHLLLDLKRISILRQKHIARTEAMISFLENTSICREKMLLDYFGEHNAQDCGHCDICRGKQAVRKDNKRLTEELFSLVKAEERVPVRAVLARYPKDEQEAIGRLLRQMTEAGRLQWQSDGYLQIPK